MSRILAIDPGCTESAYVVIEADTRRPVEFAKVSNADLLDELEGLATFGGTTSVDHVAIEMVASYGMPVGREVFETCVWIGRYRENIRTRGSYGVRVELVYRQPIKLHHCGSSRAKDSNITQALVDRFAPGAPNKGKGTKANPGWFHGFAKDVWQAYALAVYVADTAPLTAVATIPQGEPVSRDVAAAPGGLF